MWQEKDNALYKKFTFKDFSEAFGFMEKVAVLADQQNHHPTWTNTYKEVEIWLTTHTENSITDKDKTMAKSIDEMSSDAPNEQENTQSIDHAKLFTDGGSRGNPGPSALGFVLLDSTDNVVKKGSKYLGTITNNQAEYMGLQAGLEEALSMGIKDLEVYMDSLLVINQVKGLFKVKNAELLPINQAVKALAQKFESISFTHVPRAMNSIADQLVNECLDAQR